MEKIEPRKTSREEIAQRILVGCGVFGGLTGAGSVLVKHLDIQIPAPVIAVTTVITVLGIAVLTLIYWRMIDEAAREAHKFAWFWGGMAGAALALVGGALTDSAWLTTMYGALHPAAWLAIGMATMLIAQAIGYLLAWAGWWLVRQR